MTAPVPPSPGLRGRPPIGPAVLQRFTTAELAAIDAAATAEGVKRAEMIRRLVGEALAARGKIR